MGEIAAFGSAGLLLALALTLGGASRLNPLGLMVVELAGVIAIVQALVFGPDLKFNKAVLIALALAAAVLALTILQLTPLPPSLWRGLPGREPLAQAVDLGRLSRGARSMSLAPEETGRAALYLLAPVGMFLAALQCDWRRRAWLVLLVVALGIVGLAIGAVQASGGGAPRLRLYADAALGLPSGVFANRNHQASFMAACVVLAASLASQRMLASPQALGDKVRMAVVLLLMALFAVGAAATLSRAGVLLLVPALAGGFLLLRARSGGVMRLAAVGLAVLVIGVMVFAVKGGAIFDRFEAGGAAGGRLGLLPQILTLGRTFQPWGGGIGSFDTVYRATERLDQIDPFFLNHVHNDYVEAWLEAGWPAIAVMAAFAVWWGFGAVRAWTSEAPHPQVMALSRAGALVTALLLAHSAVDYPLRTPALAVLFAFGCALMLDPLPRRAKAPAR